MSIKAVNGNKENFIAPDDIIIRSRLKDAEFNKNKNISEIPEVNEGKFAQSIIKARKQLNIMKSSFDNTTNTANNLSKRTSLT
jgi:hypothetical protein